MQSSTDTAASQKKMPRSELIRRYLVRDLANLRRAERVFTSIDEIQILGYFEQVLLELEKYENYDTRTIQPKAG